MAQAPIRHVVPSELSYYAIHRYLAIIFLSHAILLGCVDNGNGYLETMI